MEPFSGEKPLTVHPRLSRDKRRRGGEGREGVSHTEEEGQAEKIVGGRSDERRGGGKRREKGWKERMREEETGEDENY